MPAINKIRVSNVFYDNNSRYYDDIVIPVNNGRLIIQGVNGTGKTLLMQVALQSAAPNLFFYRKNLIKPTIKYLMETNKENKVIHSIIEWTLDEGNEHEYMMTGYCVRPDIKDTEDGTKFTLDSFNYVILYNNELNLSVESIPLKNVKANKEVERMSYQKLKNFLNNLSEREDGCIVKIFEKTGEYESFLNSYNINSSEYNLMKSISGKEGGSEEYFTENYRTAYDFIVKELVHRIESVDKMHLQGDYKSEKDLAENLFEIKSTMNELQHKQSNLDELIVAESYFNMIIDVNNSLISEIYKKEQLFDEVAKGFNTQNIKLDEIIEKIEEQQKIKSSIESQQDKIKEEIEANNKEIDKLENDIESLNKELNKINNIRTILKARKQREDLLNKNKSHECDIKNIETRIENIQQTINTIKLNITDTTNERKTKEIENLYVEYLKEYEKFITSEKEYEIQSKKKEEIIEQERIAEGKLLYAINLEIESIRKNIDEIELNIKKLNSKKSELESSKNTYEVSINTNTNIINSNLSAIKENSKEIIKNNENIELNNKRLDNVISNKNNEISKIISTANDLSLEEFNDTNIIDDINNIKYRVDYLNSDKDLLETIIELDNYSNKLDSDIKNKLSEDNLKLEELQSIDLDKKLEKLNDPLKAKELELANEKIEIEKDTNNINSNIKNLNTVLGNAEDLLGEFTIDIENLSDIIDKHSINDRFKLATHLKSKEDTLKSEDVVLNQEISILKDNILDLESNKGVCISDDTKKCYEILSKAYSSAILGADFNETLNIEAKEELLSKSNLIPVSILLNNTDYNSLKNNKTLLERVSDFITPVINIDKVKEGLSDDSEVIYITSKDKDFYIDEDKRKKKIEDLKNKLSKLNKDKEKLGEQIKSITAEYNAVFTVNTKYQSPNFEQEQNQSIRDLKQDINRLKNELQDNDNKIKEISLELEDILKNLEDNILQINREKDILKDNINKLSIQIKNLNDLLIKNSSLKVLFINIKSIHSNENNIVSAINELKNNNDILTNKNHTLKVEIDNTELKNKLLLEDIENTKLQISALNVEIDNLNSNIVNFKSERKRNENILADLNHKANLNEITTTESISSLEAELKVIIRNKETKFGNISDIQTRMKEAFENAEYKLKSIDTNIVSLEELNSKKNVLRMHDITVFREIDERVNQLNKVLDETKDKIKAEEILKSNAKTLIDANNQAIMNLETHDEIIIEDSYNPDKEESLINSNIDNNKEKRDSIKNINKDLHLENEKLHKDLRYNQDIINKLDANKNVIINHKEAITNTMDIHRIAINTNLGEYTDGEFSIKEYNRKINRQIEAIKAVENEHEKIRLESSNRFENSAFDMLQVLNIIKPQKSIAKINDQNEKIKSECLGLLSITKDTIINDLKDLNELKDAFIEKCLTKANGILNQIKKLEKLVTIEYNGKKIPLIKLTLNELTPDEKIDKMTTHINTALGQIEDINDAKEDKVQIEKISKYLAASRLLEQVISNPKTCNVEIFVPRDETDVTLNARYVTWGGVTSGGQGNTVYFTVTIALLLFIRELSTDSAASRQTKVLYADGVFRSSASDYLWECIYTLLDNNKIQLIVTNMGTSAALMKMFDTCISLEVHDKRVGGNIVKENRIGHNSFFKSDSRSLKSDNILHNFGEYRLPKKEVVKQISDPDAEQMSLL